MKQEEIKSHWEKMALQFKNDVNATTKTMSIKKLEIFSLIKAIKETKLTKGIVLEVGCGNGINCFALFENFPQLTVTGVDFVEEMITSANDTKLKEFQDSDKLKFYPGDILKLDGNENLEDSYDIVFTDRCIINLNTLELQRHGIKQLINKVKPNGYLIIIENIVDNHQLQNSMREFVGLEKRSVPPYNLFINEKDIIEAFESDLEIVNTINFGSLHDLLLYIILPMTNGGKIDYENPIVHAAADLLIKSELAYSNSFGSLGQNKLYLLRKK